MSATPMNAESLRSAFDTFNQHSSLLEASYRELQDNVSLLASELKESQSARHRELLEKERVSNRLTRILETVPGAIIVLDGAGIVREHNSVAVDLLNSPLLGCAWSEIARREFRSGKNADGELRLRDNRLLSLARRPLQSEPGEILLLTDITESRQTADLVQRQQRLSAIGEMTARLAHQIRTPLASALLNTSQLKSPSNAGREKTLDKITARLNELARMVNDMLRFAGGARGAGDSIVVRELLDSVVDSLSPQVGSDCDICIELDDPVLTVTGNRDALKAALLNLASNAIQACAAAPQIELAAVSGRGQVCLTVSDNGQGIPASIRERIFDPFFTTRPQGTGLGLAVVRSIAEAHRGEVLLQSGASGTTFCLCLPVEKRAADSGCPEHEWQQDTAPLQEYAHG